MTNLPPGTKLKQSDEGIERSRSTSADDTYLYNSVYYLLQNQSGIRTFFSNPAEGDKQVVRLPNLN